MEIQLVKGDITKVDVDAIVNAANSSLLGGEGVDGAIHKAGGNEILDECLKIRARQGECKVGEAVFTTAGRLRTRFVIHTVGPVWRDGKQNEQSLLEACYRNSLILAEDLKLETVAFPNISTGVYGFPKPQASVIAVNTVKKHKPDSIRKVIFVCFDEENFNLYRQLLNHSIEI